MVSFKRYKKGKPYVDDLELLGYSHDRLIEIISQTQKQITCSKCLNVTVLKKLGYGEIYSGQYGIYFKCHSCQKNVSISSKVDFNRDHELIEIDNFINNFNKDLKITQKQYDAIKSLIKNLRKELKDKRATMLMLSDGKSKYEKEKIYQEAQSVQIIDEGHFEDKYKVAFNFMEKYCYSSDQNSGVYRVAGEVPIPGGYLDYWGDYNSSSMISHESKLNPNKTKDLEAIEEHHLKPFIKKKEKRILLLKKIFRSSKGSVYVAESPAMPGFYKIGWTNKSPHERAKELSAHTGVPEPFKVIFSKSTSLTGEVEKEVHLKLDELRHRSNREFFKGDLKLIKKIIEEVLSS